MLSCFNETGRVCLRRIGFVCADLNLFALNGIYLRSSDFICAEHKSREKSHRICDGFSHYNLK